jgi:hypothetical protein
MLFPQDETDPQALFIDWSMWDIGRATDDLAYMIALHWYPERRARFESLLLKFYYDELIASGVRDYTLNRLLLDYRLSVVRNLFIPIWQWKKNIHPSIWYPHLERGFLAFEDLDCRALLD